MMSANAIEHNARNILMKKGWKQDGLIVDVARDRNTKQHFIRMHYFGNPVALTIAFDDNVLAMGFAGPLADALPTFLDYTKALLLEKARS